MHLHGKNVIMIETSNDVVGDKCSGIEARTQGDVFVVSYILIQWEELAGKAMQ
jgi:hypothetical protein